MRGFESWGNLGAVFLDSDKIVNPVDLDFSDLKNILNCHTLL